MKEYGTEYFHTKVLAINRNQQTNQSKNKIFKNLTSKMLIADRISVTACNQTYL